ncbi:MAG: superinfection immunity protein [Alphaproteobacteria bacterium]|nr:superinfection immunity protein [Alphaproteobacteria bacterium]
MQITPEHILIAKYIAATIILACVILTPAYLAAKNGKDKFVAMRVRVASWVFGWTGVGWLLALFWAVKK